MEQHDLISTSDVIKIFRMKERQKGATTIFHFESKGEIPTAQRVEAKGKHSHRKWDHKELPQLGRKLGFLASPREQHVISVFTSKGGVLKTTLTFNIARSLALHGIKVCIVGCDTQMSMNHLILGEQRAETLEELELPLGLFHLMYEKEPLENVIRKTDLPTLDFIPEGPELAILNKRISGETRREYVFKEKLIPMLKDYQVIIFDNPPSWNHLIENSLVAANHVISPASCNIGGYHTFITNNEYITEFQDKAKIEWDSYSIVPTMKEKNKLSEQIYGFYLTQKPKEIAPAIRASVLGQEALVLRKTIFEHAPKSPLGDDYFDLITHLWSKILSTEAVHGA